MKNDPGVRQSHYRIIFSKKSDGKIYIKNLMTLKIIVLKKTFRKSLGRFVVAIFAIDHFKLIGNNFIGTLNHVKKIEFFLSSNVYFYSLYYKT